MQHGPPRKTRKSSLNMAVQHPTNFTTAIATGDGGPSIQSIPRLGATDLATAAG